MSFKYEDIINILGHTVFTSFFLLHTNITVRLCTSETHSEVQEIWEIMCIKFLGKIYYYPSNFKGQRRRECITLIKNRNRNKILENINMMELVGETRSVRKNVSVLLLRAVYKY